MAKADKATAVADITEQFKASTATVITEYRGLTVANMAELRRSLGGSTTYAVAKNTLVKRAASEAGIEGLDELFAGPTAIAFITGEPVEAAKAMKTFAKDNKALVIKGGYMDGRALTVAEVERIADLEIREVLLAKLAGAMKAQPRQGRRAVQRARHRRSPGSPPPCRRSVRRRAKRFRRPRLPPKRLRLPPSPPRLPPKQLRPPKQPTLPRQPRLRPLRPQPTPRQPNNH